MTAFSFDRCGWSAQYEECVQSVSIADSCSDINVKRSGCFSTMYSSKIVCLPIVILLVLVSMSVCQCQHFAWCAWCAIITLTLCQSMCSLEVMQV